MPSGENVDIGLCHHIASLGHSVLSKFNFVSVKHETYHALLYTARQLWKSLLKLVVTSLLYTFKADARCVPSQEGVALLWYEVCHWLDANLESTLYSPLVVKLGIAIKRSVLFALYICMLLYLWVKGCMNDVFCIVIVQLYAISWYWHYTRSDCIHAMSPFLSVINLIHTVKSLI